MDDKAGEGQLAVESHRTTAAASAKQNLNIGCPKNPQYLFFHSFQIVLCKTRKMRDGDIFIRSFAHIIATCGVTKEK